jgi:signal transduction histidine kinase
VQVDRSQLTQVFVNLATNAIEAMDGTGGQLTLKARVDGEGSERRVRVEVSDTGPGIRPEVLPKIWEVFYTSKPEGTGLGLSIVRGLVAEQPGATIDVESVAGQGTTFTLTMLVAGAPRPTDPSGRPAIEPAKG